MTRSAYLTSRVIVMLGALVLAAGVLALSTTQQPANAASPAENGKLVFGAYPPSSTFRTEIFTINPDGTGLDQLTHNTAWEGGAAWSPDGKRIAFDSAREKNPDGSNRWEVYVMRSDGTGVKRITNAPGDNTNPTWSPSGNRIAFRTNRHVTEQNPINSEIYSIKVDGTNERRLTHNTASDLMPDWSPDGTRIAFYSTRYGNSSDIFVMNADGYDVRRVTSTPSYDYDPDWSPSGTRIAFSHDADIYTVRPDGRRVKNLTNATSADSSGSPAWSPDGRKIAFDGRRALRFDNEIGEYIYESGIYLINPNSSREEKIPDTVDLNSVQDIGGLDWQPLP